MKMATMDRMTRASDIMARNLLSISETATVRDAAAFLLSRQISSAPIINEAGRTVGVVSLKDIARYAGGTEAAPELNLPVREIMDDDVSFVRPETPIDQLVDRLIRCDNKRLFVSDTDGVLVGVICPTDVLSYLNSVRRQNSAPEPAIIMERHRAPRLQQFESEGSSATSAEPKAKRKRTKIAVGHA